MKNETTTATVVEKQKGRPSNPNSKRQQVLQERETKKAMGIFRKGRPTIEGSKRQEVLAARAAKAALGIEVKRGRPKMVKQDTLVVPENA
jgi:hypothetical protein